MRILCIAPLFVPVADSEAFCSAKMVMELSKSGADIITISWDPYWPIQRPLDDSNLWRGIKEKTIEISSDTGGNRLKSIFAGIEFHSLTYTRWIRAVVDRAIELHRNHRFDIIYSRSLPMIAHVAGYWISRKLGRPWIANINDPWDFHLFPDPTDTKMSLPSKVNSNFWFKRTLRSANLVTYPTKRLRDYHIKLSGIDHEVEIIPHIGYSNECDSNAQSFRLTHTGKLGTKFHGRSTRGLLRGFKGMLDELEDSDGNVKLVLVGPKDIATEQIIKEIGINPDFLEIAGRVNYEESLRYIAASSVCILIEGKHSEGIFLPSKFVDYLVAKKPIIALSPKSGTIADFGDKNGIVRIDSEDSDSIKYELCRLYGVFKQDSLMSTSSSNLVDRFSGSAVANQFLHCAQKLLYDAQN